MTHCKGCTNRHIGCHSDCELYKQDIDEHLQKKKVIKEAKAKQTLLNCDAFARINSMKKGRR